MSVLRRAKKLVVSSPCPCFLSSVWKAKTAMSWEMVDIRLKATKSMSHGVKGHRLYKHNNVTVTLGRNTGQFIMFCH